MQKHGKASQAEVDKAKAVLTKAFEELEEKPGITADKEPVKAGDTTAGVKTGDETSLGMLISLAGLSILGLAYSEIKRKY